MSAALEALQAVPWLAALDARELVDVARIATVVHFRPGAPLVGELEIGDELYVLVRGRAQVSVAAGDGRRDLNVLGPGDTCGELSLLTHQLRSATVGAVDGVEALRLGRAEFDVLVTRHPTIAVFFANEIAKRVVETDAVLDALLLPATADGTDGSERLVGKASAVVAPQGSIARAWRELVVNHRQELPFLALLSFTATLLLVRLAARALEVRGMSLFDFLRAAYLAGIGAVLTSTAVSLVRFRRDVQRAVALVFGVGFALVLNELPVFLAFDSFYLDMQTADPKLVFSVETLYRRSEGVWAATLAIAFLVQLTFLRRFYRRAAFVVRTRWAGFRSRRSR